MLADGTIASAGGKVVKNVAGYDLARLVCGSRGRLGLIARASFRLHPLPRAARTLASRPRRSRLRSPRSSAPSSSRARSTSSTPAAFAVLFEGSPRAVEAQVAEAQALVGGDEAGAEAWEEARARVRAMRAAGSASTPAASATTLADLEAEARRPPRGRHRLHP